MKTLKRTLALTLVLCMLCSFFPVSAFAAEASAPTTNLSTSGSPFQKGTGESNSFRIPALVTLSDGTLVAAADARWNTTYDGGGLDTMVAISEDNGATWTHSFANYLGDNGNAYNGSSSTCFIDPALAVTSDDTIYMLCDLYPYGIALNGSVAAYPNTDTGFTDDGYLKLDYNSAGTYGYYLKDGMIYANGSATPLNGYTVDDHFNMTNNNVNPATTTNLFFADSIFKVARTGFLYLTKSIDGGESWSAPQLLNLKNGTELVCLAGPGRGLVTKNGTIVFPVYSFPGDPTDPNAYTEQRMGFIYSTDGTNWQRSVNLDYQWASESAVVELNDGTLRFFFRNGSKAVMYVDYNMTAKTWGTPVNTGVASNSNCQVSAISLNHTVDGKQVILVSCPQGATTAGDNNSSASARLNGKIHLFTVGENNALTKVSTVDVPSVHSTNSFMYSCLTAQKDAAGNETGDISILYEDQESQWGTGNNSYYQMSYKTFDVEESFGVTFGGTADTTTVDVPLKVGEEVTKTIDGVALNGNQENDVAKVEWVGTEGSNATGVRQSDNAEVDLADCLFTFTNHATAGYYVVESASVAGRYLNNVMSDASAKVPFSATPGKISVTLGYTDMFRLQSNRVTNSTYEANNGNAGLHFHTELANPTWNRCGNDTSAKCHEYLYRAAKTGETASTEIPGYVRVKSTSEIQSGESYLIAHTNSTNWYVLYPGTSENECVVKVNPNSTVSNAYTTVTITGKSVGNTTVEVGNTTYNITVTSDNVVNVPLKVNETSQTYTIDGANHENNITQQPDSNIATMTVTGVTGTTETTVSTTKATELEAGATYIIRVFNTNYALSSNSGRGDWGTTTRAFEQNNLTANAKHLWTLEASGEGFKLKSADGYLNLGTGNNTATLGTDGEVFTIVSTDTGWTIKNPSGRYINALGGLSSYYTAGGWTGDGTRFDLYKVTTATPASTEITFKGVTPGTTTAVVGNTQYNITVSLPEGMTEVKVELEVGESKTYTDTTGNYADSITREPDDAIAEMTATHKQISSGDATYDVVNELVSGEKYLITKNNAMVTANTSTGHNGSWSSAKGLLMTTDTAGQEQHLWTITKVTNGYTIMNANGKYMNIADNGNNNVTLSDTPVVLTIVDNGDTFTIYNNGFCLNNFGGENRFASSYSGTTDVNAAWTLKKYNANVTDTTEITFTGVSEGKTSAIVGNTLYIINVVPSGVTAVDITVEVGESFTFTDLTGNHANEVTQEPDGTKATMSVVGVQNTYKKSLVHVTALTFDPNKQYVIENVQAKTIQPDCSVLTSEEVTYTLTGLVMNGPVDVNTSQTWTITSNYDNNYYITHDGKYLHAGNQNGSMVTDQNQLALTYVEGKGWTIVDDGYYLCDLLGINSGEAFGTSDANDGGIYWNIYEVVDETTVESTEVTFTGVTANTTTTAIVGGIQYNINVIEVTDKDEVLQSAIDFEESVRVDTWVVEPQFQRDRYYDIVDGKRKDLYTDESWKVYETARQAAYKKLTEVTNGEYPSAAKAQEDLKALEALIDALKTAEAQLVSATIISVKYHVNQVGETPLDIKEYKITSKFDTAGNLDLDGLTVELPRTIVVGDTIYEISNTTLELEGAETYYDVIVSEVGKVGGGFVGSADIDKGYHNEYHQLTDLVDENGVGRKITELTFTTGFSYDLNLATDTTGKTVTWTIENEDVATVDQNGNVTAVAPGTTYVTATITENGEVVEVNTIPVNVFQSGTGSRVTGLYAEQVDNTTVWCVVNADTDSYAFEVIEGELIYGQFDKTVNDAQGTKTTAMSFFGDPDEAHALVLMQTNQAAGDYYLLHDDNGNLYDGTKDGMASGKYYVSGQTTGAGYWQAVGLTNNVTGVDTSGWQLVKDMVQWAINKGCDGGLGFTRRQGEGNLCDNLYFVSDPMARIEKTVDGVLPVTRKKADYETYKENMVAAVKEQVYFKITVTLECPTVWTDADETVSAIQYTNAIIADTVLPGAFLYSKELDNLDGKWDGEVAPGNRKQTDNITDELNAPWTADEKAAGKRVLEYYLVYEIQESDIPKFWIDNIANLSYDYKSEYSAGAQAGSADAEARISVTGSAIENVVIDFGQSFVYAGHEYTSITDGKTYTFKGLTDAQLKGAYVGENAKTTASYGDVTVEKEGECYTVTYTPHSILQGVDVVQIFGLGENDQEKVINGFQVYPASTVYYEEGFILDNNNGWNDGNAKEATTTQTFEMLGTSIYDDVTGAWISRVSNKKHEYGFDPIYDGIADNGEVADSSISSKTLGATTEFTFTGTGFELFADCTENSGFIHVMVNNAAGENVKMFMVNTVVLGGSTSATNNQTGDMDALPIVSLKDLEHGTYTVILRKVMDNEKTVTIDGVRIINTLADSAAYTIDLEDNPEFYQLRDAVMSAKGIMADTSKDYIDPSQLENMSDEEIREFLKDKVDVIDFKETASQVYNSMFTNSDGEAPAAVITSPNFYVDDSTIQDLLDKGPKNEIYLWNNQTLTFKVSTQRVMQIGLKAPSGETTYKITCTGEDEKTANMAADTDMFYYVVDAPVTDVTEYTISITNTGNKVLAITDLKVCDDPTAALVPLTEDDVRQILVDAGYTDSAPETPEEPAVPFADVQKDSFYYDAVAWAVREGITTGISESHFGPLVFCNRAQVVTFLWRAAGCPEPTITAHNFVDVEAGSFYEKAVLWALENRITTGTGDNHFSPLLTCNRAQVVTFLYRAFKNPAVENAQTPFSDVPADTWYTAPIQWAVEQGITTGIGGGLFGVNDVCNRAQIVTFLFRAYN